MYLQRFWLEKLWHVLKLCSSFSESSSYFNSKQEGQTTGLIGKLLHVAHDNLSLLYWIKGPIFFCYQFFRLLALSWILSSSYFSVNFWISRLFCDLLIFTLFSFSSSMTSSKILSASSLVLTTVSKFHDYIILVLKDFSMRKTSSPYTILTIWA